MNEDQLRGRTDLFIANVLKQKDNFSEEVVAMAQKIYDERNLNAADKKKNIADISKVQERVFDSISLGTEPSQVINYMYSLGIEKPEAKRIARIALTKFKNTEPEDSKIKGNIIIPILVVGLIIKLILNFI